LVSFDFLNIVILFPNKYSNFLKKISKNFIVQISFLGPYPLLTPSKAASKGGYGEPPGGQGAAPGTYRGV